MQGFERSEAVEAAIREHAAKLELFHAGIISCRVAVEETRKHHHQGREFTVRVDVRVPGREIAVTRDHHEDVYVALRDGFDLAKRRLEEVVREKRGDVKAHEATQRGRIARLFTDGYGFIETADDRELYFSRENVAHPLFEHLAEGDTVEFIEHTAAEGPQAQRVSVVRRGSAEGESA
jgi:cold shock CspA family protein/ribosome-associated translation inhibitor RaiA